MSTDLGSLQGRNPELGVGPRPESRLTARGRAKADRKRAILDAAATLFAERGYNGVSIEDLGAAAGVSGPAVYRHFAGKPAVLAALLIGVSEELAAGGSAVIAAHPVPTEALRALIEFHVDFALNNPAVIRVQDRDLTSLDTEARHTVRLLQRGYVELWVDVLRDCATNGAASSKPAPNEADMRVQAHAVFGLINSTPHSARTPTAGHVRETLIGMATRALGL